MWNLIGLLQICGLIASVASVPLTLSEAGIGIVNEAAQIIPDVIPQPDYLPFADNSSVGMDQLPRVPLSAITITPTTTEPGETTTEIENTTGTTPSPADLFICPQPNGLFPYEGNCTAFFQCNCGTATLLVCPSGLYFNPSTGKCDWPTNVACEPVTPPPETTTTASPDSGGGGGGGGGGGNGGGGGGGGGGSNGGGGGGGGGSRGIVGLKCAARLE